MAPPAQEFDRGGSSVPGRTILGASLSERPGETEGIEHPRAVLVGLVIPALSSIGGFGNETYAEAV